MAIHSKENEQKPFQSMTHPQDTEKKDEREIDSIYNEEQREYVNFLQQRIELAYRRDQETSPLYNNRTRAQYYEDCQKVANTWTPEKKNEDDVIVASGSVEQKLDAILSNVNGLNLGPEVMVFDEEGKELEVIAHALEDIIERTEKDDGGLNAGDEEKKAQRQRALLKYGEVFVQEEWLKKWEIKKNLKKKYNGEFKDVEWEEKLEKVFEGPNRRQLYGLNVFVGDTDEFYFENQPYFFTLEKVHYDIAKSKYGKFENWKYVKQGKFSPTNTEQQRTIFDNTWRLTSEFNKDQVEIITYYDKTRDDFQVIINGVMMFPVGFPLSAVSPGGVYNVTQQIFRPLSENFAHGGSFVLSGSLKRITDILDEMLKLFVLKTRKSFTPAYANTSGRVIDKKVLSPGRISMVDPNALQPLGVEIQGVTAGEAAVLEKFQSLIDQNTVSPQFLGQKAGGTQTATETLELQRQAKLTLGLIIFSTSLLEKKLTYLRIYNIIANWFNPISQKVVGIGKARKLINQYRGITKKTDIDDEGTGEKQIIVQDSIPEGRQGAEFIREQELDEEKLKGKPVRKIFLKADGIRNIKSLFFVEILPKEKESSAFNKLLFREMIADAISLVNLGSLPNVKGLEEKYGKVWEVDKSKIFGDRQASPSVVQPEGGESLTTPNQIGPDQQPGRSGGNASLASGLAGGLNSSGGA